MLIDCRSGTGTLRWDASERTLMFSWMWCRCRLCVRSRCAAGGTKRFVHCMTFCPVLYTLNSTFSVRAFLVCLTMMAFQPYLVEVSRHYLRSFVFQLWSCCLLTPVDISRNSTWLVTSRHDTFDVSSASWWTCRAVLSDKRDNQNAWAR